MAIRTSRFYALSFALLATAGLSCDRITAPLSGAIDIAIANETLDAVRVTVTGATNKTVTQSFSGASTVHVDGLGSGTYAVKVEGLIGGQVAHYGEASVSVTAGSNTAANVPLTLFRPVVNAIADTVKVLHFTVEYAAVPHATSYIVEWSRSHNLTDVSSDTVTGTSTEIVVPTEGRYYFVVRAVNGTVTTGGMPSDLQTVYALQAVATVTVLPATPSIADGATQLFAAVARDAENTTLTGITFFWASSNNSVATVNQAGLVTSVSSGQATITALAKGVPGSAVLTVTPLPASKLVFTSQPSNTAAGQSISSIKVAVQNTKNQTATGDNTTQVTLAIGTNPGGGVISGTAVATVVNGVASFDNISINRTGANYTLSATATSLTTATSTQFNVTPGTPAALAFTAQPTVTTAGAPIAPAVQVEIRDALGNRVVTARDVVTLAIGTNPASGALSGTRVVNAIDGVASFSGLSIDKVATGYTLAATSGSFTGAESAAFPIVATGTATRLGFSVAPGSPTADDNISVTVRTEDSFGNLVSSVVGVTISLGANSAGGTLTGTTSLTTTAGEAVFSGLHLRRAGTGYTIVATAASLTAGVTNPFNVAAGVPAQLAFTTPPTAAEPGGAVMEAFQVTVQDAFGNRTNLGTNVSLGFGNNPGSATLSGTTTVASSSGLATFTDIAIDNAGDGYTLIASAAGLTDGVSDAFDVSLHFVQMSAGELYSCGVTSTGRAFCWGTGDGNGRLGNGVDGGFFSTPQLVLGGHRFTFVSTGYQHACGIRVSDGAALCWGEALDGKLGNGVTTGHFNTPQLVGGGHAFSRISASENHTCAIRASDQAALCWGPADNGRLGNNQTAGQFSAPQLVDGSHAFIEISAGWLQTCAVRTDRTAYCWGSANNGRLGNLVSTGDFSTPQAVAGGHLFRTISSRSEHTCGVRFTDDRILCWGMSADGRLGNATTTPDVSTPGLVVNGIRFAAVAAAHHTCAVALSGGMFCWGAGAEGQLGNAGVTASSVPVSVLGGLTFTAATAGVSLGTHACGVTATGAYCWGTNGAGELGDGTFAPSTVPVRVKGSK